MSLVEHASEEITGAATLTEMDLTDHERSMLKYLQRDLRQSRLMRRRGTHNFIVTYEGVFISIAVTGMFSIHRARKSALVLERDDQLCCFETLKRVLTIACAVSGVQLTHVMEARLPSGNPLKHFAYSVYYPSPAGSHR